MIVTKQGKILQYCCKQMVHSFKEVKDQDYIPYIEEEAIGRELMVYFRYNKYAGFFEFPIYEKLADSEGDFFWEEGSYTIKHCPFCGKKLQTLDAKMDGPNDILITMDNEPPGKNKM
jgi:hypothetical protein